MSFQQDYYSMLSSNRNQDQLSEEDFFKKFTEPRHSYVQTYKFTSDYYKDLTKEKEIIERAFQSNNYTYIRQLPKDFKHNKILDERLRRAKQQLDEQQAERSKTYEQKLKEHEQAVKNKKMQQVGSMGYFQAFTYYGQQYDYAKYITAIEKMDAEKKRKEVSEFDFRPSDTEYKAKYEDPFQFRDKAYPKLKQGPNYLFPFNIPSDTYSSFHQSIMRKKMNEEAKRLAGPFLPAMNQKTLVRIHRSQLNEILKDIQYFLHRYLKKYPYILAVTIKDHIQLLFEEIYKSDVKLRTVMSLICENDTLSKYLLKRDVNRWGFLDGAYICFSIVPPWVSYSTRQKCAEGTSAEITKILGELEKQPVIDR